MSDDERRLSNGAMVVCGPGLAPTLGELRKAGLLQQTMVVAADRAALLALPDTLMVHAMLIYAHYVPGAGRGGPDPAALEEWRRKVLGWLRPAMDGEPVPEVSVNADPGVPEVLLQLNWMPRPGVDWRGVRSSQVKRVAEDLDAWMASANGGVPAGPPAGKGVPVALLILILLGLLGAAWYLSR